METPLSGGRITHGVMRKGDFVCRPLCANSGFAHRVLLWLEQKGLSCCPRFISLDESGREITTYLDGETPSNLGYFTDEQCLEATRIIMSIHDAMRDFPDCLPGQTICHNDLSPCNFRFTNGMPYAVFDWDTAALGSPHDDLAYAVWMWLDIGNDENDVQQTVRRMKLMLDAYGVMREDRTGFTARITAQMRRVASGDYPTAEQAAATREWAQQCEKWLSAYNAYIHKNIL